MPAVLGHQFVLCVCAGARVLLASLTSFTACIDVTNFVFCLLQVAPAVSISYVVYENMRMQLGVYR